MPVIDLTRYVAHKSGLWTDPTKDDNLFGFTAADTMSPGRLLLRWAGDFVALAGPLRVRVTVQSENMTVPVALVGSLIPNSASVFEPQAAGTSTTILREMVSNRLSQGRGLSLQASTIYSYTLDIAAGQAWPFSLAEQLASLRLQNVRDARGEQLGNNLGFRVIIEPAFATADLVPVTAGGDLPCDFAVANQPNTAQFFPSACEPCEGSVIGLPPSGGVSLVIPPAAGGCVRTRFFNGMFITREDLETEQRYHRLKSQLHNRASGAGVVWGLAVGRRGSLICVMPGYGVDCCGNDLALTSVYEVEIAALLADPASRSTTLQRGARRMSLLLEYVECPLEPRPVHGDPCSPEASRCEMSRIRESVRLRLVPPRDYDAARESAPIGRFLKEVQGLRERDPLEQSASPGTVTNAPFTLRFTATDGHGKTHTLAVRPAAKFDPTQLLKTLEKLRLASVKIEVVPDPLWIFVGGTLTGEARQNNQVVPGLVTPSSSIDLAQGINPGGIQADFTLTGGAATPDQIDLKVTGWQAQTLFAAEDSPVLTGDLTLVIRLSDLFVKEIDLRETEISEKPIDLAENPCGGEPCAPPAGGRTFGTANCTGIGIDSILQQATSNDPTPVLPWLHADPFHPGSAADPKVLVLAALGGWLSQMLVREKVGTGAAAGEVLTARRSVAQELYGVAWLLLFGVRGNADSAGLGTILKRLFENWCNALLWKGPQCVGDPHGVVIGCVVVEGGTIRDIDPFGGRRHVVHYPLLEHWGAQFGVAPPDVTASRFFSTLCCLSALPAIGDPKAATSANVLNVGNAVLAVGAPNDILQELAHRGIVTVSQRKVTKLELVGSLLTAVGNSQNEGGAHTALVLDDIVAPGTVMLLLPA